MVDAPRDFAGKDLRNRSFRGQDLRGADFSDSNLRGCDFREANLVGASFERAEMGKSLKQLAILAVVIIASAGAGAGAGAGATAGREAGAVTLALAVVVAVALAGAGAGTVATTVALAESGALVKALVEIGAGILAATLAGVGAGAGVGAAAVAGRAAAALDRGSLGEAMWYSGTSLILVCFTAVALWEAIKAAREAHGTNFQRSDLTGAVFRQARVCNTKFSDAKIHWVDWEGAQVTHLYFEITPIFQLELDRSFGSNRNYSGANFENRCLNDALLQGANLWGANLSGAKLQRANFSNSNLTNVKAVGTDFTAADFTGAIIQNWGITKDTKFDGVRCNYIYLSEDKNPQSRKPLSGYFSPGDFAKVVTSLTETLDFLLHAHDDPQAFIKAMQEMIETYGTDVIQPAGFKHLGDGDRLFQFEVAPGTDTVKIYTEAISRMAELQLEADRQRERANWLETERNAAIYRGDFLEKFIDKYCSKLLDQSRGDQIYINSAKVVEVSKQKIDTGGGDVSGVAGGNISGVAGKDIQGAAGRDLSGQVMLSIESLRQSDIPEAPTLADLLSQLKDHIDSSDLPAAAKTEAQSHIEQLAKAPTLPTAEGIQEAAEKSIGFFKTVSLIIPSLSTAINDLLGQIASLLGWNG